MNLETKITIYKFTPQLFTLTQNYFSSKDSFLFSPILYYHHKNYLLKTLM